MNTIELMLTAAWELRGWLIALAGVCILAKVSTPR